MRLVYLLRRPMPLALLGQNWLALPLRLGDLADLESVAMATWEAPTIPTGDMSDPAYRDALRATRDAFDEDTPEWGSDACSLFVFNTMGGKAMTLKAVLREHDLSDAEALDMAEKLTPEDWQKVDRIAWGTDPAANLMRYVDRLIGVPERDIPSISFAEALCEVASTLCVPPGQLADMTLPEFRVFRMGGNPDNASEFSTEDVDGWHFFTTEVQPRRAAFWNEGKGQEAWN